MSGIWNRIIPGGENADRLNVHLIKAAVYLVGRGAFTAQQALDGLNSQLSSPLSGQEITDLNAILTNLNGQSSAVLKIDYLERVDALNIAVENGILTDEAVYRAQLGI